MGETVPISDETTPRAGSRRALNLTQEGFCLERCTWRKFYNEIVETPVEFSYADCKEIVEKVGSRIGSLHQCGLAELCVAFAAKEGAI